MMNYQHDIMDHPGSWYHGSVTLSDILYMKELLSSMRSMGVRTWLQCRYLPDMHILRLVDIAGSRCLLDDWALPAKSFDNTRGSRVQGLDLGFILPLYCNLRQSALHFAALGARCCSSEQQLDME